MAQIYNIQLTQGNSEGTYSIYYNQVNSAFFATAVTTNQIASNLPLSTLLSGLQIAVPDNAGSIIIFGSVCENILEFPITPKEEPPPIFNAPPLCFKYDIDGIVDEFTFLPDLVLVNQRIQWTSDQYHITWNPLFNNGQGRWEMVLNNIITFWSTYTSSDGVPDGNWDSNVKYAIVNVSRGECKKTEDVLTVTLSSTPNSCSPKDNTNLRACDGIIVVSASGGLPPYRYSIDGQPPQNWNTFQSVCPGQHTILTIDSANAQSLNTIDVGTGGQPTTGTIQVINRESQVISDATNLQETRNINVRFNNIEVGTTFQIKLIFENTKVFQQPGTGTINNSILIYKNLNNITNLSTISNTSNSTPIPDCATLNMTTNYSIKEQVVSLSYGDQLVIETNSNLQIITPQVVNSCRTKLNDLLSLRIEVLSVNCNCCEILGNSSDIYSSELTAQTSPTLNEFCLNYGITCNDSLNIIYNP